VNVGKHTLNLMLIEALDRSVALRSTQHEKIIMTLKSIYFPLSPSNPGKRVLSKVQEDSGSY
jgi:hypothetical protein